MKRIKLLLLTTLSLFAVNSIVFAQDTTLTVTNDGKVGIGMTNPQGPLHVKDASGTASPSILIERNSSQGGNDPTPRLGFVDTALGPVTGAPAWLIDNFNDRFRIFRQPNITTGGAEMMTITNTGNVGIGTAIPNGKMDIVDPSNTADDVDDGAGGHLRLSLGSAITDESLFFGVNSDGYSWIQPIDPGNVYRNLVLNPKGGNVGIGTTSPSHPLEMASGAHVTVGGVWADASSRALKENIRDLTGDEAARTLSQLAPKRYNYKVDQSEEYLGFIAEDVPDLVATGNRKSLSPMDIVAVLTKVLQEQQKKIAELETRLNSIQQ